MIDRKLVQQVFIRICRDSRFKIGVVRAASLTARTLGCHPLEIWLAMPDWNTMDLISVGMHPAARKK